MLPISTGSGLPSPMTSLPRRQRSDQPLSRLASATAYLVPLALTSPSPSSSATTAPPHRTTSLMVAAQEQARVSRSLHPLPLPPTLARWRARWCWRPCSPFLAGHEVGWQIGRRGRQPRRRLPTSAVERI
uniref:Uncharacterized protein n=1 Tax=Oryza rufipogon TaxID=4529 RepID=A0A0E0NDX9_ORYRU